MVSSREVGTVSFFWTPSTACLDQESLLLHWKPFLPLGSRFAANGVGGREPSVRGALELYRDY